MARRIKVEEAPSEAYGIRVIHPDGVSGWIVGEDGEAMRFASEAEAMKALRKLLKLDGYSWNCETSVAKLP